MEELEKEEREKRIKKRIKNIITGISIVALFMIGIYVYIDLDSAFGGWLLIFAALLWAFSAMSIGFIKSTLETKEWKEKKVKKYGLVVDTYQEGTYYGANKYIAEVIVGNGIPFLKIYYQDMGTAPFSYKKGEYLIVETVPSEEKVKTLKKVKKSDIPEEVLNEIRIKYEKYKETRKENFYNE